MLAAVAIASLPFATMLVVSPVLRRLAVRNAVRRPRETLLVILGSLLGTAILTGSFVVGDTLEASLRRLAHTQLGPIDEVVVVPSAVDVPEVAARAGALPRELVDGVLPIRLLTVSATTTAAPVLGAPRSQLLEVDFPQAQAFGGDAAITGIAGRTPAPGRAVLTSAVADRLRVEPGSQIAVHAYGRRLTLRVEGVLEAVGVAGYWHGLDSVSRNIFVAPGTIESLAQGVRAPGLPTRQRPVDLVAISNKGGVEDGAELTGDVRKPLQAALAGLNVEIREPKRQALDSAAEAGTQFSTLFAAMGSFGVVAGILLLVNIFVMLAEERRSELGMLRAIGLLRSRLILSFSAEGWLYAVASSAAGAAAGVLLGRLIASIGSGVFAAGGGSQLDLRFAATLGSVERGFALGFLISIVTVVAASVRISRFNIIQAIRELPQTAARRRRVWTLVAGGIGILVAASWLARALPARDPFGMLLAPILLVASLVPIADRFVSRRLALTAGSFLALAWGTSGMRFYSDATEDSTITLFVAHGIAMTASAVLLVSQNQESLATLIRRLGGGTRGLGLRLALAYPLARRFRTGMTLAMYTLVVFTITFITVFTATIGRQIQDFAQSASGGFDILLVSNPTNPVPPADVAGLDGVDELAVLHSAYAQFAVDGPTDLRPSAVSAFDDRFLTVGPPALSEHDERFDSDEDTYRAVLEDPSLVIVPTFFLSTGRSGPPRRVVDIGEDVTMVNPFTGDSRVVTVAGFVSGSLASGALYGISGARELFGADLVQTPLLLSVSRPDPSSFAAELSGQFVEHGADASAISDLLVSARAIELRFFGLVRGYLGLGLVVGIAGLGVVMIRAVRERRRQIGVLRALGFRAGIVRRAFVLESAFVALEGTLIGVALALVSSYSLVVISDVFGTDVAWEVPAGSVAVLVAGTLVMSLLATAAPSQAASRVRPAVALRAAD